jgi:uncharacterized protein YgiM (DUF1202 family)
MSSPIRRVASLCIALLALSIATTAAEAKAMSVNVKETKVMSTPSYLGKILGSIVYGDRVQVTESKNGWVKVSLPGKTLSGWINESALTMKKVVLSSGSGTASQQASSGEVALAGKGFNSQIEAENRKDATFDYATVDRMERTVVAPEAVAAFLKAGGLAGGAE